MPSLELSQSAYDELKRHFTKKTSPFLPKDWTIVEDVPQTLTDDSQLEFLSFLKDDEKYINGDTMRERAKEMNTNLGSADAQYLLDNQSKIPLELRNNYIVFPGTIVRNSNGHLHVACFDWGGDRWILYWGWLGVDWSGGARFGRSKSLYT